MGITKNLFIRYEQVRNLSKEERISVITYLRFMNVTVPKYVENGFIDAYGYSYYINCGEFSWSTGYVPLDSVCISLEELKRISKLL